MSTSMKDRWAEAVEVSAALAIGTLGCAVLLALPGLVGAIKHGYGFDDVQVGYLSSADLTGLTLGSACAARFIHKIGLRHGTWWGLLIGAVANAVAVPVVSYWPLLALRFVAGIGGGVAVAGCYIAVGRSRHVDRYFSFYMICQLVFGGLTLQFMPSLSNGIGIGGVFGLLAGLYALALLLPRQLSTAEMPDQAKAPTGVKSAAWVALAATLVYFVAQGSVWAYLEVIGERGGLAQQTVANGMAISTLTGLVGPVIAAMLGSRVGRAIPLFAGLCVGLSALYLLSAPIDVVHFLGAACLFSIAWNFSVPYQLASIAAVDRAAFVTGWAAPVTAAGLALGPFAATFVLRGAAFTGVLWLSAALISVSFVGFIPAWRCEGRAARAKQQVHASR